MPASSFIDDLHDARTRWLSGDADAWPIYLACCRHLESERHAAPPIQVPDDALAPRPVRQRTGRGTTRRRGQRAPSAHE